MYIALSESFNGFKLFVKVSTFFLNGFPIYIPQLLKAPSIGCWVGVWVILKILSLTGLFLAQPLCIRILTVATDTQHLAPAPVQTQPHLAHITPRTYPSSLTAHGQVRVLTRLPLSAAWVSVLPPFMPRGFCPSFKRQPKYHCFLDASRNDSSQKCARKPSNTECLFTAHCVQLQDLSYYLMFFSICIFASFSLGVSAPEKATAILVGRRWLCLQLIHRGKCLVEGMGKTLLLAHTKCTVWLRVIDSVSLISKTGKQNWDAFWGPRRCT